MFPDIFYVFFFQTNLPVHIIYPKIGREEDWRKAGRKLWRERGGWRGWMDEWMEERRIDGGKI
jgi:hypothetical protein